MNTKEFHLYTDGGCWPNPGGRGGWCSILLQGGEEKTRIAGALESTTNNRAELMAIIAGLRLVPKGSPVVVFTDSQYAANGCSCWMHTWARKGWRKKGEDIKNRDLWELLFELVSIRNCKFQWVRGHSGNFWNEECDKGASLASKNTTAAAPSQVHPPLALFSDP